MSPLSKTQIMWFRENLPHVKTIEEMEELDRKTKEYFRKQEERRLRRIAKKHEKGMMK